MSVVVIQIVKEFLLEVLNRMKIPEIKQFALK